MTPGLSGVAALVLCATVSVRVFAWDNDCKSYTDSNNKFHSSLDCKWGFCCGTCNNRHCCTDFSLKLSEDTQDECEFKVDFLSQQPMSMVVGIVLSICVLLGLICCCICPCCCIYKMCRKPQRK
ncbi:hypothetical protein ATANTOWER_027302 [Ataeniobius toweri]|uniref:Shisa N-terminal domain-containing protein n=1 Tax=Ataeniobius toweri TaxID=208326 RepID=A0ABU7A2Z5_9TELE|nr:hypothetical protein [Ataeniobius toweri]